MRIKTLVNQIKKEINETFKYYKLYPDVLSDLEDKVENPEDIHWQILKIDFDDYENAAYTCGYIEGLKWAERIIKENSIKKQIVKGER